MRPEDAAGKVQAASLAVVPAGRVGMAPTWLRTPVPMGAVTTLRSPGLPGPSGCRPLPRCSASRGSAAGDVLSLAPEPWRTGMLAVFSAPLLSPGCLRRTQCETLYCMGLPVAVPQNPSSLPAPGGQEQELRVCLTLFRQLFLKQLELPRVVLMKKAGLPKSGC